jgi:glutaredoxin
MIVVRLTVYIAAGCPHCAALLADFEHRHVAVDVVDLTREPARTAEVLALTRTPRLPVVVDHERASIGFAGRSSTFAELGLAAEPARRR